MKMETTNGDERGEVVGQGGCEGSVYRDMSKENITGDAWISGD